MARVVCASQDIDPKDIAPVANLLNIADAGSTSSIEIEGRLGLKSNKLLRVQAFSV